MAHPVYQYHILIYEEVAKNGNAVGSLSFLFGHCARSVFIFFACHQK
jgi:hypothetical protein